MDLIQWYCGVCGTYGGWRECLEAAPAGDAEYDVAAVVGNVWEEHNGRRSPSCDGSDLHWSVSRNQAEPVPYRARPRRERKPRVEQERLPERLAADRLAKEYERLAKEEERERERLAQAYERERLRRATEYEQEQERQRRARIWRTQEELKARRRAEARAAEWRRERQERERRDRVICAGMEEEERRVTSFRTAIAPFERRELREAEGGEDCPYFSEPFKLLASISLEEISEPSARTWRRRKRA